jgi:hypothetical protein
VTQQERISAQQFVATNSFPTSPRTPAPTVETSYARLHSQSAGPRTSNPIAMSPSPQTPKRLNELQQSVQQLSSVSKFQNVRPATSKAAFADFNQEQEMQSTSSLIPNGKIGTPTRPKTARGAKSNWEDTDRKQINKMIRSNPVHEKDNNNILIAIMALCQELDIEDLTMVYEDIGNKLSSLQ